MASGFWLVFWHQSEARKAATIWNWSGKTFSPGALLAVLYFSLFHIYFSARLEFPSPPLSAPGSPRMRHPLPAPFDSPHLLLSLGSFNVALSRANWAFKENACTAGYFSRKRNNHSQRQQMVKPRALACTVAYAKLKKRNNERFILKFGKLTQYFCMKSNFWTIKTVFILVKVCVYMLCTRQCQGYCLMGAWSPEVPTIYLWTTKIWNKKPEQVHENHNSQDNFCSINNKIPLSFCTFEAKTENVWSSAIGKKYFRQ